LDRLKDRVAVVTGGGNGIGKAITTLFAQEGALVSILDVDREKGTLLAHQINSSLQTPNPTTTATTATTATATPTTTTTRVIFLCVDISKEEEVKSAFETTVKLFGRIDLLVNNAAVFVLKNVEQTTVDDWNRSLSVNVIGAALCTKYAAEHMKKNKPQSPKGSSIVNLASVSSWVAQKDMTCYSVSKGAILSLTRNCAVDLAPFNIRVNCVCPGFILTDASRHHAEITGVPFETFVSEACSKQVLNNRSGTPEDVAHAVLFLSGNEASFITGTHLIVDGGFLEWR